MTRTPILVLCALLATVALAVAAPASDFTETNVLQNITLQLTNYQQGLPNGQGTKVAAQVSTYNTKDLITALQTVTGNGFGPGAKLVRASTFSSEMVAIGPGTYSNVLLTNFTVATSNLLLDIGGIYFPLDQTDVLASNMFTSGDNIGFVTSNVVQIYGYTNDVVTINTNADYLTTFTPSTNNSGLFTNVAVLVQQQLTAPPTASVFTNISTAIDVLDVQDNTLYDVTPFVNFNIDSTNANNSIEIVTETGAGLDGANDLTDTNLSSQTGYSIQYPTINYFTDGGSENLTLNLTGFVKSSLKLDTLSGHGTNKIVEDIFGASSTWNVIGSGFIGGTATTNTTSIQVGNFPYFLTNANPVVVQGTINFSFFKNQP